MRLSLLILLAASAHAERAPVLVELFTSEGCSSCPPADRLLQTLDADAIVLEEHVDYWDRLGWRDPFSSPKFTARQEQYSRVLRSEVYTPQMVIDGREQVLGNDAIAVRKTLSRAASIRKRELHLRAVRDGDAAVVTISTETKGELWIAIADESAVSGVAKGENAGRTLKHVSVARTLQSAGKTTSAERLLRLSISQQQSRVIAFVTDSAGRVVAAAMVPLP